jgi:hypothetical protein
MTPSKADPSMNIHLNGGTDMDGVRKPWAEIFTRLSDEAMADVRRRLEAKREEEQ